MELVLHPGVALMGSMTLLMLKWKGERSQKKVNTVNGIRIFECCAPQLLIKNIINTFKYITY